MDILAGGEVHERITTPTGGPGHLFHLFGDGGGDGRVTDIGVDLHPKVAADDHRFQLRVIDVGGNDGTPCSNLRAHKLRGDLIRDIGAKAVARMLTQQFFVACVSPHLLQATVLADRNILHLRSDDPLASIVHLGDIAAGLGNTRSANMLEAQVGQIGILLAFASIIGTRTIE